MNDAAIVANELRKTYRGFVFGAPNEALRGLSLRIERGVAFGLIGPNGAGKTTFIKLLLNVARPTSGEVHVLGGDPEDPKVRARVGYLPERMHLPAALSGLDFLWSVSRLKRLRVEGAALHALLDRVGLGVTTQRIGTYSKGMRQRLGLAAAMLGEPELLVLDEPTDGIDPVGRIDVRELLLQEKRRGATILLNSHLLAETEKVCDRVGILEGGLLRREGTLHEVRGTSSRWRIRFARSGDFGLPRADDGSYFFDGDDVVALNAALDAARARGALLVEVTRQAADLEQVLVEVLT